MATTSTQARLDRLFKNKIKPQAPASNDTLTFWEQELLDAQQRREQETARPEVTDEEIKHPPLSKDVPVLIQAPSKSHSTSQKQGRRFDGNDTRILYLPKGRHTDTSHIAELDINDEDYESDTEPLSSSRDLIGTFCIFSQVTKFPYKFMQDPEDHVSIRFFAGGRIYERKWDMFFLFGSDSFVTKPLMLVPLDQVQTLIKDIGKEFQIDVSVPEYPFQLSFYKDGTPSPTYVGHVKSKSDLSSLQTKIQSTPQPHPELPANPTESQILDRAAWEEKLESALEMEKKQKNSAKRKKRERRREMIVREDINSLKRAQRYLGLRPKLRATGPVQTGALMEQPILEHTQPAVVPARNLDLSQVAPYPFDDDTVFISVDVESWEMDHSMITEIGVSTLDTADIKHIAPGPQGENWIKKIRSRHFRIKGRNSLRNFKFCEGYPDMFQFGVSEFCTIEEAPSVVDSCFEHPYSAGFERDGPPQTDNEGNIIPHVPGVLNAALELGSATARNLLLVGHDVGGDIAYLSSLGSTIFNSKPVSSPSDDTARRQRVLSSIRERLDTATLYKALTKDSNPRALTKICYDLDIKPWYPHNAGNDARYTLEALIKMVIKARQEDDKTYTATGKTNDPDLVKDERVQSRMMAARKTILDRLGSGGKVAPAAEQTDIYTPFCGSGSVAGTVDGASVARDSGDVSSDEAPY